MHKQPDKLKYNHEFSVNAHIGVNYELSWSQPFVIYVYILLLLFTYYTAIRKVVATCTVYRDALSSNVLKML